MNANLRPTMQSGQTWSKLPDFGVFKYRKKNLLEWRSPPSPCHCCCSSPPSPQTTTTTTTFSVTSPWTSPLSQECTFTEVVVFLHQNYNNTTSHILHFASPPVALSKSSLRKTPFICIINYWLVSKFHFNNPPSPILLVRVIIQIKVHVANKSQP